MPCDPVNAPQSWTCAYDGVRVNGATVYLELLTPGDIDPQGVADSALGLAPSTLSGLEVDTLVVYVNGLDRGSTSID